MPDFAGYVVISLSIISTFSQSVVKPYKKQFLDFFSLSSCSDDDDNLSWTFSNAHGLRWCKQVSPYMNAGEERLLDGYCVRPGMERIICELCFDFTCYL